MRIVVHPSVLAAAVVPRRRNARSARVLLSLVAKGSVYLVTSAPLCVRLVKSLQTVAALDGPFILRYVQALSLDTLIPVGARWNGTGDDALIETAYAGDADLVVVQDRSAVMRLLPALEITNIRVMNLEDALHHIETLRIVGVSALDRARGFIAAHAVEIGERQRRESIATLKDVRDRLLRYAEFATRRRAELKKRSDDFRLRSTSEPTFQCDYDALMSDLTEFRKQVREMKAYLDAVMGPITVMLWKLCPEL